MFVTVEGGEGVGKSTFVEGLCRSLKSKGIELIRTFEPGGCDSANSIRNLFLNPPQSDPLFKETELFLVSAARAQHMKRVILPALAAKHWVICDRFHDSTRVYQGKLGGLPDRFVDEVIGLSVNGRDPDITLLLDCDLDVMTQRLKNRAASSASEPSRFDNESLAFHAKLKNAYLELAARFPARIHIINANGSPEQVLRSAIQKIEERR
ncbi:MAG: dTMP kinase [Oligoflexales bacterium]